MQRATSPLEFGPSPLAAFSGDHRRLDHMLRRVLEATGTSEATETFAEFARDLRRHVRAEDLVLFAAFENRARMHGVGPTAVMRREHREIERRLEIINSLVADGPNTSATHQALRALKALLEDHNRREEMALYPACERVLDADERARAVSALLREEE